MSFFTLTGDDGNTIIINGNTVSKVIDFGTFRTVYQGGTFHQVTDTLASILTQLQS